QLLVRSYTNSSDFSSETILLSDVTTPIANLVAGGSGLVGIYNDLGGGTAFGSRVTSTNESGTIVAIPLNAAFLNALLSASGGQIALGGSLTTLNGVSDNEYLFGFSQGNIGDVQLELTFANQ